jgi:hypothetical protein
VVSQRTKGPGDATAPLPPWHTAMRWEYLLLSAGRKRVVSGTEVRALQEGLCPFFSVPDVIRLGKEGANPHIAGGGRETLYPRLSGRRSARLEARSQPSMGEWPMAREKVNTETGSLAVSKHIGD